MIRGAFRAVLVTAIIVPACGSRVLAQSEPPFLPGLHRDHPLDERATGELLLGELGCAACHDGLAERVVSEKIAPDLSNVGARVQPGYLERFILDPRDVQPGTTMPALLTALPSEERAGAAEALAHFLRTRSLEATATTPGNSDDVARGRELYHSIGCVACHAPLEGVFEGERAPITGSKRLDHVREKYSRSSLADFLFDPHDVRPSGRMPDMLLTRSEARAVASYLIEDAEAALREPALRPELVERGRELYRSIGCVSCHALDGVAAPDRREAPLDLTRGCLSASPARAPDFGLSDAQRSAITAALSTPRTEPTDQERIDLTLTALSCVACHVRDAYGGVPRVLDPYFRTTEHDLGDEARIPPPLTLAGAKLQSEAMRRTLFDDHRVRPYMVTRMPRFGAQELARLPELFDRVDTVEAYEINRLEGDAAKVARDAGRELLGNRGLACISCHNFNGVESPNFRGMDLLSFPERLEPDWFAHFVIAPQRFRPGIVMPESWSGGVAAHQGILDGDTRAQIEAIWHFLSLGTSAANPSGITPVRTTLEVTDTTRTYRGRSSVAGYRGIAVGFPGGLNYAFNANTGTLSALWSGDFISVRWDGQGAGGFNPRARAVQLAQDVSFYRLSDPDDPWPLRPVMTEEAPVNPDPLYPKNRGYRFGGYFLDESSNPTFMYRSNEVEIEDTSVGDFEAERPALVRALRFRAPDAQALTLRALTGSIESLPAHRFRVPGLELTATQVRTRIRPLVGDEASSELLLELDLPSGESTLILRYELLRGLAALALSLTPAEDLGDRWGTAHAEREFYPITRLPLPEGEVIEAGAFCVLPDERIAVGTRRGDIWFVSDFDGAKPEPRYELFATGLDEIFGLAFKDGALYVTQSCELTRVTDTRGDGKADRFDTISDDWGYANYHEYAFGSKFDEDGNIYIALGLSQSYNSRALFRGWAMQVTPEGETIPIASGLRSPAGIGPNEHGALFYIESQGPWNSSCSLKAITPGSFMGHPISFNWYDHAPNMGPAPTRPESGSRIIIEKERVPELVPYSVIFPYIRMGRSISGFTVDRTQGGFGPFANQMFLGDFSLSVVMRATTEQVNGVWQGACYPFREGLSTGILNVQFTPRESLLCGGTNRGWPVRGIEPFALERIDWTGKLPFEIERIEITQRGFDVTFTKPVDEVLGADPASYALGTFTHIYHAGYGGPEVDRTSPTVESVTLSEDRKRASLVVEGRKRGHVHELDLGALRSTSDDALVHSDAYYTVNEIPHPVPADPRWLTYPGASGPGEGKHIVLIAADQEYRSEQSLPMLARILATRHGFDCTVLFALNGDGEVDPTQKIRWQDESVVHDIPGLEHLAAADLVILFSRLVTLPDEQLRHVYDYLDSGKPIIGLRTANHGFIGFEYEVDGERVRFGDDVLGGAFRGHHGRWHQDSTRGIVVPEHRDHPVLIGVEDVWGPSDVYRTYAEDEGLPAGCTPLLMGQPLTGRQPDDAYNDELIALPVAWVKSWTGNGGRPARVFHSTMGSARDFESAGLRRLLVNAVYWCLERERHIDAASSVEIVGEYTPLESGFDYEKLGVVPHPPEHYR